jgi:hypothetical protein
MSGQEVIRTATLLAGVLILAGNGYGQETTNTNCTLSGNTANCTSNTTDYGAEQQRSFEEGQQVGSALGQGIGLAMQRHSFTKGITKYCAAHPGADWHYYSKADGHVLSSGHCPTEEEKVEAVANEFLSRHKDFIPEPANSKAMIAYMESHKLNPVEKKSYDRAYKALKKARQLDLYSK